MRDYGDRLVRDHRTANAELQALAARKGWQVPAQPDPQHMATRDRLMAVSDGQFDRRFTEEMVKDHPERSVGDTKALIGGPRCAAEPVTCGAVPESQS